MIDNLKKARELTDLLLDWQSCLQRAFKLFAVKRGRASFQQKNQELVEELQRFEICTRSWRKAVTTEVFYALRLCGLPPFDGENSIADDVGTKFMSDVLEAFEELPVSSGDPFNTVGLWREFVSMVESCLCGRCGESCQGGHESEPIEGEELEQELHRITAEYAIRVAERVKNVSIPVAMQQRVRQEFDAAIRFHIEHRPKSKPRRKSASETLLEAAGKSAKRKEWTAREWSEYTGIKVDTVKSCKAFKVDFRIARDLRDAEADRRRNPTQ